MEEAKGHYDQLATRLEQEVGTYKSEMSQLDSELKALHKEEELLKSKLLKTESRRGNIAKEMAIQRANPLLRPARTAAPVQHKHSNAKWTAHPSGTLCNGAPDSAATS